MSDELGCELCGDLPSLSVGEEVPDFKMETFEPATGQFGGAHESEVRRIKNEDSPLAVGFEVGKADFAEGAGAGLEGFHFEIRHLFTHAQHREVATQFTTEFI